MLTEWELQSLDKYLDPPNYSDDRYDKYWDVMADFLYDQMKESEVIDY